LALLVALGVEALLRLAAPNLRTLNRLAAVIAAGLIAIQGYYYFGPYMATFNEAFRDDRGRGLDVEDALFRSVDFPDGTNIIIIDSPAWYPPDLNNIMHYLRGGPIRTVAVYPVQPGDVTEGYLSSLRRDIDTAFYVNPLDRVNIDRIVAAFPAIQGPLRTEFEPSLGEDFLLYYLPASITPPESDDPAE
jgi:hypothetical protein